MTTPSLLCVASAQFSAAADVDANLATITRLAHEAVDRGARIVVFPEAAMYKQHNAPGVKPVQEVAQDPEGPFGQALQALSRETGALLVVGMAAPGEGGKAHNLIVVVHPTDGLIGVYDKIHLFDSAMGKESDRYHPGVVGPDLDDALVLFDYEGLRFGVSNCYDLRFPELYRALADRGAEVMLVPAAWVDGPGKAMHWEVLLRARAIENTAYVVSSGQTPPTGAAYTQIIDPRGSVLASGTEAEGILIAWLDPERVRSTRQAMPILANRRIGVHAITTA